jgi:hypothetical protein
MDPITIAMGLAQFAPGIIKLLTGSDKAADVAADVIGIAQKATGAATGADALDKLRADPTAVMNFQAAMAAQQADLDKAYLADMADARGRDVELAKAGHTNHRANAMAACAVALVLFCLLVVVWKAELNEFAKGGVTLILGRALGWVEQAFSFEFGSTRASKAKDDTIKALSR